MNFAVDPTTFFLLLKKIWISLTFLAYPFGSSELQAVDQTRQQCELLPNTTPACRASMHGDVNKLPEKNPEESFC